MPWSKISHKFQKLLTLNLDQGSLDLEITMESYPKNRPNISFTKNAHIQATRHWNITVITAYLLPCSCLIDATAPIQGV